MSFLDSIDSILKTLTSLRDPVMRRDRLLLRINLLSARILRAKREGKRAKAARLIARRAGLRERVDKLSQAIEARAREAREREKP